MADLRIVDAPEIPTENITGEEKLPTGGNGNYSISLDSLADYTKTKKDLADNTSVDGKVGGVRQELDAHIEDLINPHQVTKGQIGLGNVDNTADADKPVSNSTQAAIISAVAPKADKTYVDTALSSKTDKTYVDGQLTLKANKADVYTKSETYTKQESSDLVNNNISTALTPVNSSLDLAKRGIANRYDSSLTYNSGERVVLSNGDIVKSTIDGNVNDPNVDMTGWVNDNSVSQIFDENGLSQQMINNGLGSIADLLAIPTPKHGNHVFVKSIQKWYTYNINLTTPANGVTVVGKWEMDIQEEYFASWFADSTSNESQALKIQAGYDYATSKKRAFIIDAEFWVDVNAMDTGIANGNRTAILTRSNSVMYFTGQGKLKALPNNYSIYALITACGGVDNFIITYPKLQGEVFQHIGTPTEWGYGLAIYECSNGYIKQPHCSELTGDGIYVGKSAGDPTSAVPKNILIEKPVIRQVRRNGISFCAWDNVTITYPDISYVGDFGGLTGAYPKAGIDIEPEMNPDYTPSITCRNGVIESPHISNCSVGVQTYCGLNAIEVGVHIKGITTLDNITEYATSFSWGSANCVGLIKFDHIHFTHIMPTDQHLRFMFDATGTLLLEIDRVSYDFRDKGFTVIHNPIGIYAANLVGNVHINNFDVNGNVFVQQVGGVDNHGKILTNFKLIKSKGRVGDIIDIDQTKNPFPNTSCVIESSYTVSDNLLLAGYAGGNKIIASRASAGTININSASNARRLHLEYDKTKTGYIVRLSGIKYLRPNGLTYTAAASTMRGAWIEFENIDANNTIIHGMSEGWTFS